MKNHQKSILVLAVIAAFIGAGYIEPPQEAVGGSENPISTMETLHQIPPAWSQVLPASKRFELVMGGKAVLDKETGLVWKKSLDLTKISWVNACSHCYEMELSGRKGWRLPTIEELASLVDTTQNNPALPDGHRFSNVQSSNYWSSTTYAYYNSFAWSVHFYSGNIKCSDKNNSYYVWCVRGRHGHDAY